MRAVIDYLPKGHSLPEDVWRVRHRTLTSLLWVHVVAIFGYALVQGNGVLHSLVEAGVVGVFALAAQSETLHRKVRSGIAAMGLVTCSAILVHLSDGLIEMHFHFFVVVGILTLYQDWLPFLTAIGFVVAHHGVMGALYPSEVYNHPDAIAHPFKWAFIHGFFVLAASAASIVAWRLNEEQALKDALTGLPNRRLFQDRVAHALARVQRRPEALAVLFVDLDGFKDVNDTVGHAAGDELLGAVAERLRATLRTADTAARLGGDEFAILIEDVQRDDEAIAVADRLLTALAVPFELRGKPHTVGASIGIAMGGAGDTVNELLRNADLAMYTVKSDGRGQARLFKPAMHAAVVERTELEADLRRALREGEWVLEYQPVVALATGRLAGVEALIRWQHPERGLLQPDDFMDMAEASGEMSAIGAWVLGEACRQASVWIDRYPDRDFTMAVNVSPSHLQHTDLVAAVRAALDAADLPASRLVIELTEAAMVEETPVVVSNLKALKALGVKLAVDDFGTSYSSLSYLRQLPIDIVKIDKLFVDSVALGTTESEFARSIMELARTLRLATVAEGVEDADQVARLRALGCELGQGFRFAHPLSHEGVDALLEADGVSGARPRGAGR